MLPFIRVGLRSGGVAVCLLLSMIMLAPAAAQGDALRVTSVVPVSELIDRLAHTAVIAPDGTTIASVTGNELCLYAITADEERCLPLPDTLRLGSSIKLEWSPDGRFIATAEDAFRLAIESDIWLFEVASQRFINRTDDSLYGSFLRGNDVDVPLDYLPTWDSISGDLYFFRVLRAADSDGAAVTQLHRIPASELTTASAPQLIGDYTALLQEAPFSIYPTFLGGLAGAAQLSPDGRRLAVLVRPIEPLSALTGVWVIDLASGEAEQVISRSIEIGTIGWPAYAAEAARSDRHTSRSLSLTGLQWVDGGRGLVLSLLNEIDPTGVPNMLYYYDFAEDAVTPLIDFSTISSEAALFTPQETTGLTPLYDNSYMMMVIPGASGFLRPSTEDVLLYLNMGQFDQIGGLSTLPLPPAPNGNPPNRLYQSEALLRPQPMNFTSLSIDGQTIRVLLGGYLITLERG